MPCAARPGLRGRQRHRLGPRLCRGHRRQRRAERDRQRHPVRRRVDHRQQRELVGADPVPGPGRRARGHPAPAVDAPDRCRRRRLRHARRRREDGADPPRESARRCRIGAGDHRRDLRGRGPAAHAAAEGRGCLVGLGTERLGRRAVRRPADRPAGHDRGHGPGRGPHPGHRRDRDQRDPGDADAVPPGCPGRPRRDAPAGRRGHAHPGNPPVVPQDHRVDARADLRISRPPPPCMPPRSP